jgi:lipopolysaccharide export system permease protein
MDTLDRFLIREFLSFFLLIAVGVALLFLGIDFMSNLYRQVLPLDRVAQIYLYRLPGAVQQFIPLACLMATLLVLTSMSRQNEVLALFASGVSTLRIISTFIAAVATISTVSFLAFDSLVPSLNKKQIALQKGLDASQDLALLNPKSGIWYRSRHLIYNVGRFIPQSNTLEDVTIYRVTSSFRMIESIHARRAVFEDGDWTLQNGHVVAYPRETGFPSPQTFTSRRGVIPEKPGDFKTLEIHEETMRLKDLRHFIARNTDFGLDTTAEQVHYHERVALVFAPLIFVLVGIPFALKPLKSYSMGNSVGLCFLLVFLYLLLFRMALSIGKGGHVPPVAAAWAANGVFLAVAGILILRRR